MQEHPDQVRINLRIHDRLGDPPSDDWTLTFGGRSVDQAEVRERSSKPVNQFALDERRYQYAWGSSAMVWSFVVEMAPTVGSVIAAGIAGGVYSCQRHASDAGGWDAGCSRRPTRWVII
ncbi:hypothetical protein [Nocardia brasiliensis]|uniref:hypothetical protein n=1 Tax=Nocardia brasiliensis TaxID=37326 RepID=UPI003D8D506A